MVPQPFTASTDGFSYKEDIYSGVNNVPPKQQQSVVPPPSPVTSIDSSGCGQGLSNSTGEAQGLFNYQETAVTSKLETSQPQLVVDDEEPLSPNWSFGYDEQQSPVTPQVEKRNTIPHEDFSSSDIPTPPDSMTVHDVSLLSEFPPNYDMERSVSDLELSLLTGRIDNEDGSDGLLRLRQVVSAVDLSLPSLNINQEPSDVSPAQDGSATLSGTAHSVNSCFDFTFDDNPAGDPAGEQAAKAQNDNKKQRQPREPWLFCPVGYFQLEALENASTGTVKSTTGGRFGNAALSVTPFYPKRHKSRRRKLRVGNSVILSPFGAAKVVRLPDNDSETCELLIHGWVLRNDKEAKAYVPLDTLQTLQNGKIKKPFTPITSSRKFLGESLMGLFGSSLKTPRQKRKGLRVMTSFGAGVVLKWREVPPDKEAPSVSSSSTIISVRLVDWPMKNKGSYAVAHLWAPHVWVEGDTPEVEPFMEIYKPQSSSAFPWSINSFMSSFRRPYQALPTTDSVPLSSLPMCIPPGTLVKEPYFGLGIVKAYREADRIYTVSLLNVRQCNSRCWLSYVNNAGLGDILCAPGDCIVTPFGLGKLLQIREDDAIVEVQVGIMHCFLQPKEINRIAPTPIGHCINTSLGRGMVQSFSNRSQTYCIDLGWGTMYVPETTAWDELSSLKSEEELGIVSTMWKVFFRGLLGKKLKRI